MKKLFVFFLLHIFVGCSTKEKNRILSFSKYKYSKDFVEINFGLKRGYDCEKYGLYSKKIRFKIKHESFTREELKNNVFRISWREYMYLGKLKNGEINLRIKLCKKEQSQFVLTIGMIDRQKKNIYIWSEKDVVNLKEEDEFNILLKENGGYYLR